jgi:predicted ABC-type ATPase
MKPRNSPSKQLERRRVESSQSNPPTFTIVAGPNGVGKSTFAKAVLTHVPYINGDEIKRLAELRGEPMDAFTLRSTIQEKIIEMKKEQKSFALESNLVSNHSYDICVELRAKGYTTILYYIGANELAVLNARIEKRVRKGFHYISPEDVKSRYEEALIKLPSNLKHFDKAVFIDNSYQGKWITEVLQVENGVIVKAYDKPQWLKGILPTIEKLSKAYALLRAKSR